MLDFFLNFQKGQTDFWKRLVFVFTLCMHNIVIQRVIPGVWRYGFSPLLLKLISHSFAELTHEVLS